MGRIVDGGDGDNGSGGLLPGVGNVTCCPDDLADIEQYLLAAGGGADHLQQGGGIQPSIATTKEETASSSLGGQDDSAVKVEDIEHDLDDYFAELFPDIDTGMHF